MSLGLGWGRYGFGMGHIWALVGSWFGVGKGWGWGWLAGDTGWKIVGPEGATLGWARIVVELLITRS